MQKLNHHSQRQVYLKNFFQNHLTLKARIALLTLYNITYSRWFEISLFLFEYLQLLSQIILFLPELSEAYHSRLVFRIIIYACKLVDPSYLLTFANTDSVTQSIITLILIVAVLKYLVLVYVNLMTFWDKKGHPTIISSWRLLFNIQGRMFCYFTSSFWVRAIISIRDDEFQLYGMNRSSAMALLSILWIIEYFFAFVVETQFCDILPRKNFLSGKSYHLQLITLGQKFILHLVQMSSKGSLTKKMWVSSVIAVLFSIFRNQWTFSRLPLYHVKTLILQVKLNSVVLGFGLGYMFEALLTSANYDVANEEFMIVSGIILSLMVDKISQGYLRDVLVKLFSTKYAKKSPSLLIHKTFFLKELMIHEKLPAEFGSNYHWSFLASQIMNAYKKSFFNSNSDEKERIDINKTSIGYLEDLSLKFPKHKLTQLYLINMGVKDLKISSKALKVIGSSIKRPWTVEYLSALFLLCKFKEVLMGDHIEKKETLDLTTFIKSQKSLSELKDKMVKQSEMQIAVCRNVLKEKCDIGEIFDKAQEIYKIRGVIHKEISHLTSQLPEYCIEHSLLCAQYYLVLEFSQRNCQNFCEIYNNKYLRYKKYLISKDLFEENLYQGVNAFLIVAGQSRENGVVKYCSKSAENVLGGESQGYVTSHVSNLFLPSMQSYYRNIFKRIFEKEKVQLLDKIHKVFLCHKKGYITESQIYYQIHPYLNENIYISMIIRNNSSFAEYIILKENGDIEGATKRISEQLGLSILATSSFNIKVISEELAGANEAFNLISQNKSLLNRSEKFEGLQTPSVKKCFQKMIDEREAVEVYNLFSSEGKEIQLKSVAALTKSDQENIIAYHCHISTVSFEGSSLKFVKLSRANRRAKDILHHEVVVKSPKYKQNLVGFASVSLGDNDIVPETGVETNRNRDFETIPSDWRFKTGFTTDGNLLTTPMATGNPLMLANKLTSDRQLLAEEAEEYSETGTGASKFEDDDQKRGENLADFLSVTTTTYKNNQDKAVYKAYRDNITRKSYSNSFKFLCLLFYGVILLTLLSQIILKIVYDQTMNDLVIKKDLLNYAQSRAYYASKIIFASNTFYAYALGVNISLIPGAPELPISVAYAAIVMYSQALAEANKNILNLVNTIEDEDIRREIFKKDVRAIGSIYDLEDEEVRRQTNFEAAEMIVSNAQYLVHLANPSSPTSMPALDYLRRNAENDFLFKNNEITTLFQESVNDQKTNLKNFITICLVITPLVLAGVAILLVWIIWRQYSREVAYLRAFTMLNANSIRIILKDMEVFKTVLVNDVSFVDKKMIEFFWSKSVSIEASQVKTQHSRHQERTIEGFRLQKRYFSYVVQVAVFVGILIAIVLWNFISARHYTDIIYNRQNQLQLSNSMSEKVTLSVQALAELFETNNTLKYVHSNPYDYLVASQKELKLLQNRIIEGMMELDGSYDPEIKVLIFDGRPCDGYEGFYVSYCNSLEKQGVLTNVISILATLMSLSESKLDKYDNMDRSSFFNLVSVLYTGVNLVISVSSLLANQAELINEIVNKNLSESISQAGHAQTVVLAVFVVFLLFIGFLIWIQILKRIKEVRNDFKRVLQVLPPKLILSSFLLKQFLSRASGMVQKNK